MLFNLRLADPLEARLLEIIIGHAVAAEKMGPGAFDMTLERLLEIIELFLKGITPLDFQINQNVISRPATADDIRRCVIDRVKKVDKVAGDMLTDALELAGFGGRIIVEKTHALMPSVELSRGYSFDTVAAWQLTARLEQPRALVIDGYIEQVSEIHHLLEAANEAKEPIIMFVRGLSQEVLHTLKVNFDRGSLKVVPIIVKFDLEGINSVNDLAIVTGCDLISSNKGDLISAIKFESAPRIEAALVYPNKVVLQHSATRARVAEHVAFLRDKRSKSNVIEDVGKLYDKRIRSLSPSHVVMRLPDNKDFVRVSQSIDVALRTIKSLVDHGVTAEMPTAARVAAAVHAQKCYETLASLGALLV
jgi:hypothetical protein